MIQNFESFGLIPRFLFTILGNRYHMNINIRRNTGILMKVVIPDSRILEIPGKILRFLVRFLQIRKAIDMILNHVGPLGYPYIHA